MASQERRLYSQQIGYAGEYATASELLFRGITTEVNNIDAGIDLVCWLKGRTKQIQVKTRNENPERPNLFIYDIRKSSFSIPDYFIFVARRLDNRNYFVILPRSLIHRFADTGVVSQPRSGYYRVTLRYGNNKVWIRNKKNDITPYLNNWVI